MEERIQEGRHKWHAYILPMNRNEIPQSSETVVLLSFTCGISRNKVGGILLNGNTRAAQYIIIVIIIRN
jgi:hypothetical protein